MVLANQSDLKDMSDKMIAANRYNDVHTEAIHYFNEMVEILDELGKYRKTKFTLKELKILKKAKKKGKLNKILERK